MITLRKSLQTEATHKHQAATYNLEKWTTPLIEVKDLYNFKKSQTKIEVESERT
jgi:hypothetical protein